MPTSSVTVEVGGTRHEGTARDVASSVEVTIAGWRSHFSPRDDDRLVRYVLETNRHYPIDRLKKQINQAANDIFLRPFPELLRMSDDVWDVLDKWRHTGRLDRRRGTVGRRELTTRIRKLDLNRDPRLRPEFPELPIRLEPLFPGAEDEDRLTQDVFNLDKFYLLTLPIYQRAFERDPDHNEGDLFDIGYKLRDSIRAVKAVHPDVGFKLPAGGLMSSELSPEDCPQILGGQGLTTADKFQWHLEKINLDEDAVPDGVDGSGIVIGHPDTGWTPHPGLNFTGPEENPDSPNFDLENDRNFLEDAKPEDMLSAREDVVEWDPSMFSILLHKYHGTGTSSCIVADWNEDSDDDQVSLKGVAPGATILPLRCVKNVILIGEAELAQAIWYAIQQDVDIISMSLGGYPVPWLESVIANAVYQDIIVIAATGQGVPLDAVVSPANYPECLAIGGTTVTDEPWVATSRGEDVNISAPAECIRTLSWDDNQDPTSMAGKGTSFAATMTAGAAALWLDHFDKSRLQGQLDGQATLQELFMEHLETTARVPESPEGPPILEELQDSNWSSDQFGAGILNIEGLLDQNTLPDPTTFEGRDWSTWERQTNTEMLARWIMQPEEEVKATIENIFGSLEEFVEEFGVEVFKLVAEGEEAAESFEEAVTETGEEAADAVENFIDEAVDVVSSAWAAAADLVT